MRCKSVVVFALLSGCSSFQTTPALAQSSRNDERSATISLFKRALFIVGASAYCDKYVEKNPKLIEITAGWNQRNKPEMERIVARLRATGDMTSSEKENLDKAGYKEVRDAMKTPATCEQHRIALERGDLELRDR
jgi:hypothetical protein